MVDDGMLPHSRNTVSHWELRVKYMNFTHSFPLASGSELRNAASQDLETMASDLA